MRQPQFAAGETDTDELVFWQVKLEPPPFARPATKAQPFLLCFHIRLGATQDCRQGYRRKKYFPGSSYRPNNTLMVLILSSVVSQRLVVDS